MKLRFLTVAALAVAALSLSAGSTNAYTHVRDGTAGSPVYWPTNSIWTPAEVPDITVSTATNLSATFTYSAPGERKWQQVIIQQHPGSLPPVWATGPLYLGALVNGLYSELKWWPAQSNSRTTLTMNDTTDFLGSFFFDRHSGLNFTGVNKAPTVHHLDLRGLTQLCAPAGTAVTVEHPYGFATFEVNNPKTLPAATRTGRYDLRASPGGLSFATVYDGTLGMNGRAYGESPHPPAGPWLHLDATAVDTLTTFEEGGRTYVSEWRDAEGGTVFATAAANTGRPCLVTDAATGRPTVCFGNFIGTSGPFGTNARLDLSQQTTAAKEIFVVFRDNTPSNVFHFVGGTWNTPFARTDAAMTLFTPASQRYGYYSGDVELHMGEVRVDGRIVEPNFADDFSRRLNVVSAALRSGASPNVSCLGGPAKGNTDRTGGGSLAELLVYTRALTVAERREACAYLARKWRPDLIDWDLGALYLQSATARFDVLSGTAAVRELRLPDGASAATLVKWGPGTLEIGSTCVTNLNVSVNEGAVRFSKPCALADDPQPAADPVVWMDATQEASFKGYVEDGVHWVTNWSDCRGANFRGERYSCRTCVDIQAVWTAGKTVDAAPASVTNFHGRQMLDLGNFYSPSGTGGGEYGWKVGKSGTSTWLDLYKGESFQSGNFMREGFVVFNKKHSYAQPVASASWEFRRGGWDAATKFVSEAYANEAVSSGHWALDGVPHVVDAVDLYADDEVHLMSFALRDKRAPSVFAADILARSHSHDTSSYGNASGGCAIGEIIYYDRLLTDGERADTERYLMRKWGIRGGVHPKDYAERRVVKMSFATGVDAVLDSEDDLVVDDLETTGAIVKRGDGDARVLTVAPDMTGFRAEGGALDIRLDPLKDAFLHVDASDATTFEFDGGYDPEAAQNRVRIWHDVRHNGTFADATGATKQMPWSWPLRTPGLPVLKKVSINDVSKPCLDFGGYVRQSGSGVITGDTTCASMAWNVYRTMRTAFVVCADSAKRTFGDAPSEWPDDRQSVFGESDMRFFRWSTPNIVGWKESNPMYSYRQAPLASPDAYIGVNGEKKAWDWQVPFQTFHVFAFAPTSAVDTVAAFASSRGDRYGGQQICEAIVFESEMSPARRASIERHLMRKWLSIGGEEEDIHLTLGELAVANGAALSVRGDTAVIAASAKLGGLGSIQVSKVTGVTSLSAGDEGAAGTVSVSGDVEVAAGASMEITVDPATGTVSKLAAAGQVAFAGVASVHLRAADGSTGVVVKPGFHPIVSASTLSADISGWTLDASCMSDTLDYRLVQREDQIGVLAMEAGLFIILE